MPDVPHQRTVEEAILQADAKDRVRTARHVRRAGLTIAAGGLYLLSRVWWRALYYQRLQVHVHGGPTYVLNVYSVVGIGCVIVGPIIALVGHWLEQRALQAARSNPITAVIFRQAAPFD
jgi:hypothetical protein